jgi:citrate lyase subunit beta / citryl-CoA lyase
MSVTKSAEYPGWRSALFTPVHIEKFVAKAHTRGAEAYILDMEDSVPLPQKEEARACVAGAAKQVSVEGAGVLVRINIEADLYEADLEASVIEGVDALVLPKVDSAATVQAIARKVSELEVARGLEAGKLGLIAMIESVDALGKLDEIAQSSPRLVAMTLGSEDFSASTGMKPTPRTLAVPMQMLCFACRRANILPLGFPASIADYSDLDAFRDAIEHAKELGLVGAFCIHPKQVAILNEVLRATEQELEDAKVLLEAFEAGVSAGKGAIEFKGKMIDLPVVLRARELLRVNGRN